MPIRARTPSDPTDEQSMDPRLARTDDDDDDDDEYI
jgi:hypothetical protein